MKGPTKRVNNKVFSEMIILTSHIANVALPCGSHHKR
jgi:hypothetical protein